MIKEAETAGASEAGTTATAEAARVSYDVQKAALDMQQSKAEAAVLEGHQKDFQESKEMFKKELLDIIPGALSAQTGEGAVEDKNVRYMQVYFRAVIERQGLGISASYYEPGPRLLSLENRRKIELKEISSRFIPHLLVVFTQQLEILVTSLAFGRNPPF